MTEPVRAVCLDGDSAGGIREIQTGSVVEFCGDSPIAGLVEIRFWGQRLALFEDDLRHRSEAYTTGNSDHILKRLRQDVAEASEQSRIASDLFNAILKDAPSGLPHPDGTQRIQNASREASICRAKLTLAMSRLNDFVIRGIVPSDLKD